MSNIINFDEFYAKSLLEKQHQEGTERARKISTAIKGWQKEYDKLSSTLKSSKIVSGIGTAVGVISTFILSSNSDSVTLFDNVKDLWGTPAGNIIMGVAAGGFLVAGAGHYIGDKVLDRMIENEEIQQDLQEDLDRENEFLRINENAQAINYLKSEIHGEDLYLPEDVRDSLESSVPVIRQDRAEMPRIVVIDERGGFPESGPFFQDSALPNDDVPDLEQ